MSFPDLMNGRGRRCDPEAEGKRQVPLHVENAVFSKLIRLGQKEGKTPARMAQALFDEAYAARCMGKSAAASATLANGERIAELERGIGELTARNAELEAQIIARPSAVDALLIEKNAELIEQLRQELAEAREEARRLGVKVIEMTEHGGAHLSRAEKAEADLVVARRERDELSQRCWNIERQMDELRSERRRPPAPAQFLPCEDGEHNGPAEPEPAPPAIGRSTIKAVLMLRGMNETPAEIAKNLALRREIVDQVLRENGA